MHEIIGEAAITQARRMEDSEDSMVVLIALADEATWQRQMKISYDDQHDVMYLVFIDTDDECNYVELESGDILRIDLKTNEIVGCTIMDFLKRMKKQKTLSIPALSEAFASHGIGEFKGQRP